MRIHSQINSKKICLTQLYEKNALFNYPFVEYITLKFFIQDINKQKYMTNVNQYKSHILKEREDVSIKFYDFRTS